MSEAQDPAIKLFGKKISVPEIPVGSGDSAGAPASSSGDAVDDGADQNHASSTNSCKTNGGGEESEIDQDTMGEKLTEDKKVEGAPAQSSEEITNLDTTSRSAEELVSPSIDKEATTLKASRTEKQGENIQEKTLKKPDRILPCPRCNSMDTKFCYYNNYNVNQPRHFCKNCQRYWTAGGAMRNVPVGAGRRKSKNSASHYRQVTVPESTLQSPQSDLSNGVQHPSLKCKDTVLTFGSDTRLCESMASVLNLADKTVNDCNRNGLNRPEELRIPVPNAGGEKGTDHSNKSSFTSTQPMEGPTINKSQEQVVQNQSFLPQVPYFPSAPWPFPWNPAQWSSPVPPPAFLTPGFPIPFYPAAAYWGYTLPGPWNIPGIAPPSLSNSTASNSSPNSPTLGKHSREDNMVKSNDAAGGGDQHNKGNNEEKSLWVPKTLRIDDLGEAAKSSIWTTLGIKSNKSDSIHGEGIFRAFPSKGDEKNHAMQNSPVLQANPAALSRSINFHETS